MYCDPEIVRALATNLKDVPDNRIRAFALLADSEINVKLKTRYEWPLADGSPVPETVALISNMITAGRLEQASMAISLNAEGDGHPHSSSLLRDGRRMLRDVTEGSDRIEGLDALNAPSASPGPLRPGNGYTPMSSRGQNRRRY
ncbi:hypothetical protein EON81_16125 [bacterium]|nr:MAG: hypothetical protein EON81_16125 [bacterium]